MLIKIIVTYLFFCTAHGQDDGPVVDTEYGQVRGTSIVLHNGISVNSFHGIPYAEPPIGDLRFRDPLKLQQPWDGIRDAIELPTSCEQASRVLFFFTHPFWNNIDEDCLNLNVYTPTNTGGGPYPVMVWLHGGGYQGGANIQYPGHFLAMKDVVVVVPNYRLGNLGFAFTGDEHAPGNTGMKDQILALEWVRDNIANFGGNPDQVTIFGESAGAASTGLMLMSPLATGLFHQAILESGSEMTIWAVNAPSSHPENYTTQIAEQQDCPTDDNEAMMNCLREVPPRRLIRTDFNCTAGYLCLGMAPVVDGEGGFLPDIPRNLRLEKNYNQVPEMIIYNSEDAMIFIYGLPVGRWNISAGFNREEFKEIVAWATEYFAPALPDPSREEDINQAMNWYYAPWPYIDDLEQNRQKIGEILTDVMFGFTADLQAKHHSEDSSTYHMIFSYRSDGFFEIVPEWLGVFHIMEIPYVFGLPYLPLNPDVRNNSGIFFDPIDYNDEDREYFEFISDLWTNFAKFGNPSPDPVQMPGEKGEITWSELKRDDLNYMFVGNEVIENRKDYRQQEYAFWREYLRCMNLDIDVPGADTQCEAGNPNKKNNIEVFWKSEMTSANFWKHGQESFYRILEDSYGLEEEMFDY